jgi:hypothetical protein
MKSETTKRAWKAPKLEQIAMVDTANKAVLTSEGIQPDGTMLMSPTGMTS